MPQVGKKHKFEGPFGAVLVNHETNALLCTGVNRVDIDVMRHGETDLLRNCTQLYPSATQDNYRDPCLDYSKYTIYTTGEPCLMVCYWLGVWVRARAYSDLPSEPSNFWDAVL